MRDLELPVKQLGPDRVGLGVADGPRLQEVTHGFRAERCKVIVLGILGGVLVTVCAHQRIFRSETLPAIRHTERNCLFDRRAWMAAEGTRRPWAPNAPTTTRERMYRDIDRHHVRRGMRKKDVQALLGWPDRIDVRRGETWIYDLSAGEGLVVSFNLWDTVRWTAHEFRCYMVPRETAG